MKLTKIIALAMALISVITVFTGCNQNKNPEESTPVVTPPIMNTYAAKAHLSIVNVDGKVVYSTEEEDEEMYEYTSAWYEPTVLAFLEDYCYMNDKKIEYKADKSNILKSISIITKKGKVDYKADSKIDISETVSKNTFWICLINGKEITGQLDETLIQDGDSVVLRLTYEGQDISETTRPSYVETEPTPEA